jgi:hypothetical protein
LSFSKTKVSMNSGAADQALPRELRVVSGKENVAPDGATSAQAGAAAEACSGEPKLVAQNP